MVDLAANAVKRLSRRKNSRMNARPQVREILISKKIRHWWIVARHPLIDAACLTSRARKNYARLCTRYPHMMTRLGLDEFSLYG